jgi:hypothetical protein
MSEQIGGRRTGHRYWQQAGDAPRPELQKHRTHGQTIARRLRDHAGEFLRHRIGGGKIKQARGSLTGSILQLPPFRNREQTVEVLRQDEKILQFQQSQLAGADNRRRMGADHDRVPRIHLPRHARLQTIAGPPGHTHDRPAAGRSQLAGWPQYQFLQYQVPFHYHRP